VKILLTLPFDLSYNQDIPDLGLGYLAAIIQQEGHKIELSIRSGKYSSASKFADYIKNSNFNLYGIKVLSTQIKPANETINIIREVDPTATIILGGPHVSGDPKSLFSYFPKADYGIQGEAEQSLTQFIRILSSSRNRMKDLETIPGLIYKKGDRTVINESDFCDNLDAIPFPSWELMNPNSFPEVPFNGYSRRFPIAPMVLTRGCPFKCTFCGAHKVNGYNVRTRTVKNILEELHLLTGRYGVKEIQFFDSNCAYRNGPLREVLQRIIAENINITWSAPNGIRLDSIDPELVLLMKKSGCFQVNVGIESGSPRILKEIKKNLSLELVRQNIALLRKAGIEVIGFFMIGFPSETYEEIRQTISLALTLPLNGASFSIYCPLPGTEDYERLFQNQQVNVDMLTSLDFRTYQNNLSAVPAQELKNIQTKAYLRFHLRPKILIYFMKNLTSFSKIRFIGKRIFQYLKQV
jgi:anaerobic magnesium-protoporphyrin IX monomethyl ester cyclase